MVSAVMFMREAVARSMASWAVTPLGWSSVATSRSCGSWRMASTSLPVQMASSAGSGIFQGVLVFGAAGTVVDGKILHRLHVKLNARNTPEVSRETADHFAGGEAADGGIFQVDLDAAAVERGVDAVGSDERREAFDRRVLQNFMSELLLLPRHRGERDGFGRLRNALNDARVLRREEALGDLDVEDDGQHKHGWRPPAASAFRSGRPSAGCGHKRR